MLVLSEKREWSGAAFMLNCGCPGPGRFVYHGGRWEQVDVAPVDWLPDFYRGDGFTSPLT
jgi:hypothetical protein